MRYGLVIVAILLAAFFFWQPDVFWRVVDLLHYMAKIIILGK